MQAALEGHERGVDLCRLGHLGLGVVERLDAALVAGEVDQQQPVRVWVRVRVRARARARVGVRVRVRVRVRVPAAVTQRDLVHGMRARRLRVGTG
jgi:hypothetical protein